MLVFEFQCRICFKKPLPYEKVSEAFSYFIDSALGRQQEYLEFHESKAYKYYVFDLPYPFEKEKVYKTDKTYTLRIRTVKQNLAEYFSKMLPFHESGEIQCLGGELKIIPQKIIESVYSLTLAVMKNDYGYWREHMSLPEYENRLKFNLINKYRQLTGEELDENFPLYELLEFKNKKPVKVYYKGICLLGDKLRFVTAKNETAQKIWYMAIGTGLCENNSRGAGFINYRYL